MLIRLTLSTCVRRPIYVQIAWTHVFRRASSEGTRVFSGAWKMAKVVAMVQIQDDLMVVAGACCESASHASLLALTKYMVKGLVLALYCVCYMNSMVRSWMVVLYSYLNQVPIHCCQGLDGLSDLD